MFTPRMSNSSDTHVIESASDEQEKHQGIVGRLAETPCMRTSLLYGIGGGVVAGLGHFLFTSNVRKSAHFGFISYMIGTLATWSYCRYKWSETRMRERQMQYVLRNKLLVEGTELEKELNAHSEDA
ncbi:cytochrome c oxidase assembly protein COX20, mitochondrial-like [Liolophura sinensis]|uniref:cytochrome c oxidase assembly protein COX20, mitochondrial-like n=1 Tax=Liolophura sinensis TaxID=3198878 RepID=UPI0031581E40